MKSALTVSLFVSAAIAVTGCGDSQRDETMTFAQCRSVMSDASLQTNINRAKSTPDAVCTCLEATLNREDDDREQVRAFFDQIATRMKSEEENARQAVRGLVSGALLPSEAQRENDMDFAQNLSVFNRVTQEMLDEMGENDGACPAV